MQAAERTTFFRFLVAIDSRCHAVVLSLSRVIIDALQAA